MSFVIYMEQKIIRPKACHLSHCPGHGRSKDAVVDRASKDRMDTDCLIASQTVRTDQHEDDKTMCKYWFLGEYLN